MSEPTSPLIDDKVYQELLLRSREYLIHKDDEDLSSEVEAGLVNVAQIYLEAVGMSSEQAEEWLENPDNLDTLAVGIQKSTLYFDFTKD